MTIQPNLEPLRRAYRNWRRKRSRVLPSDFPLPFHHAKDINELHSFLSARRAESGSLADSAHVLNGDCFICQAETAFEVQRSAGGGPVNLRETLACPKCGLINRWRGCLHLFEAVCEPTAKDRVYLTETLSPVYQNLASRFPLLSASEFLPQAGLGSVVETHTMAVRNEDVTQLTYADHSFEALLCFDVLEHVPDYRSALVEFYRVLCAGGQLILSVPFSFRQETVVRAVIDDAGGVTHLEDPCYHGDPLSKKGVLSYYDFGVELVEDMLETGFQESFLLCYHSKRWGYLGDNIAFVARKLKN